MKKTLILHIGTWKTGTTSIQDTLGNSRLFLEEKGLYYPKIKPFNHIFSFVPLFMDSPENFLNWRKKGIDSKEAINNEIENLKKQWIYSFENFKGSSYIISAENLCLFNINEVERVKEFVSPFFDDIKIVIYIRHFNTFLPSVIQQEIKNGIDIIEFLKNNIRKDSKFLYSNSIKHWIDIFGKEKLIARPFNKLAFKNEDLIDDFLEVIGYGNIESINLIKVKSNTSLGKNSISFLAEFNKNYPVIKNGKANVHRGLYDSYIPAHVFENTKDEKFRLDLKFNEEETQILNEEISFINNFFNEENQFEYINSSKGQTVIPSPYDININYFVELVNEYNKYLEDLQYKEKMYEDWMYLLLSNNNKDIFIWGVGTGGIKAYNYLKNLNLNLNILGFIDSDRNKSDVKLLGLPIYSPNVIFKSYKKNDIYVIIGSSYYKEISNQLEDNDFKLKENYIAYL